MTAHVSQGPAWPPQRTRIKRLFGSLLNYLSRRALILIAVLGAVVPALLWFESQHSKPLLVAWLLVYAPACWLWLKDASSPQDFHVRRRRRKTSDTHTSRVLALIYGSACGVPQLVFYTEAELIPHASMTLLGVCIAMASSAINLKKPVSGVWLARASLGLTLVGWALAANDEKLQFLLPVLFAWVFCEIVFRRSSFLKLKFAEAATRQYTAVHALRAKSQELQDTTSSRIRILGTVSHEIRQPVHALGMMVERLRIDPHSVEFRGQLDDIASVVRSLAHSLALLLDISRLEAGSVKVKKSISDVQTIMDRVTREFAVDAKRKGLSLECTIGTNFKIDTDFALFYGAVANFVSNAIRYTDKGFVKIFVKEDDSGIVWLHVRDSGRGIPKGMTSEIFKEYVRLDRENQSAQGFGLGLAIVQRTAQLLGLRVEVESTPGKGSEFRISVPRTSDSQSISLTSATIARPSTVSRSLVGLRVVLVDNDESVLRGIDSMVRSWGCVPLACQSVAELAAKLERMPGAQFDCIVADFHLGPGDPNGLDAIVLLRKSMSRFVSATLFTGDLSIRSSDLNIDDVHVAHKPVVPTRICVMFEEMAAETKRRRIENQQEPGDSTDSEFNELTLSEAMPLASAYSHVDHPTGSAHENYKPLLESRSADAAVVSAGASVESPTSPVLVRVTSVPRGR